MDVADEVRGHAAHSSDGDEAYLAMFQTNEEKIGLEFLCAAEDGCVSCLHRIYASHPKVLVFKCPDSSRTALDFAGRNSRDGAIQ
jgi:hypothetical protein